MSKKGTSMFKHITIVVLSLCVLSNAQAASLKSNTQAKAKSTEQSLIEKALTQKQENPELNGSNLKLVTSMKNKPSQSILAAQNQSFSRFVQSLFSSNS